MYITLGPLKSQWQLYVPPILTLKNYAFCLQSEFMGFE
jgi:hypothetical protein